jgi:DNA-binding response OmpR family regulator
MLASRDDLTGLGAKKHVLVVDDDVSIRHMVTAYFNDNGLRASAVSGRQGLLRALSTREPDLVILDLNLGEDDGLELLRDMRTRSIVPVIVITGNRRDEIDQVLGLELGADDYITKPFSLRQLLARSHAVLRRRTMDSLDNSKTRECTFRFEGWTFDQRRRLLTAPDGAIVPLTKSDFTLLSAFVAKPRQILSREHLLQATRVFENAVDRSIDVQILRLRRKLEVDPRLPRFIRTERGIGYTFAVDVEVV